MLILETVENRYLDVMVLYTRKVTNLAHEKLHVFNKSGKLSQDTPVLPQVVKLGHAPDKIQV